MTDAFTFDGAAGDGFGFDIGGDAAGGDAAAGGGGDLGFDFGDKPADDKPADENKPASSEEEKKKKEDEKPAGDKDQKKDDGLDFGGGGGDDFGFGGKDGGEFDMSGGFDSGDKDKDKDKDKKKDKKKKKKAAIDSTSRIKNMTISEIISLWNGELEEHVRGFQDQAMEVKKWDEQLMENGDKILRLQRSVQNVKTAQRTLLRILDTIKTNQEDLYNLILNLEQQVPRTSRSKLSADELKRDQAYQLAEDVNNELTALSSNLVDIITRINKQADSMADDANPLTQVVRILNVQMTSLQWLEQHTATLEGSLEEAFSLLKQREAERQRLFPK